MNKKAVEISTTTIIILVLAVLVLLLIAVSFTGGFRQLWQRVTGVQNVSGGLETGVAAEICKTYFEQENKEAFCNNAIEIRGLGSITCREAASTLNLGISGDKISGLCG